MPEIIDNLIFDRTQADVDNLTEKGVYRASDVNRVESAVRYLADMLVLLPKELKEYATSKNVSWSDSVFGVPYDPQEYRENIITKTDWDMYGQFFGEALAPTIYENQERYLRNIYKLREAIESSYPELPLSINRLTWYHANAIEKTLRILYDEIIKLKSNRIDRIDSTIIRVFCGMYQCGEVPFVNW